MHYCGGRLVSTSIVHEAKSCCDDDGCCQNKTIHYEVKDNYVSPAIAQNVEVAQLDLLLPVIFALSFESFTAVETTAPVFHDASPPPDVPTRLSLLQTYLC